MTSAAMGLVQIISSRCGLKKGHHSDARWHLGRMHSRVNGCGPSPGNRGGTAPNQLGRFLDVGHAAPRRGSSVHGRGDLSNRAMAIDMLHKGQLGRVQWRPPVWAENLAAGKPAAHTHQRNVIQAILRRKINRIRHFRPLRTTRHKEVARVDRVATLHCRPQLRLMQRFTAG